MTLVGAGHSIRGALASGHDRRVAVLRIRVGPRYPRRVGDLACRSTVDRQVMAERRFTRRHGISMTTARASSSATITGKRSATSIMSRSPGGALKATQRLARRRSPDHIICDETDLRLEIIRGPHFW